MFKKRIVKLPPNLASFDIGEQEAVREFAREFDRELNAPRRRRLLIAAAILALVGIIAGIATARAAAAGQKYPQLAHAQLLHYIELHRQAKRHVARSFNSPEEPSPMKILENHKVAALLLRVRDNKATTADVVWLSNVLDASAGARGFPASEFTQKCPGDSDPAPAPLAADDDARAAPTSTTGGGDDELMRTPAADAPAPAVNPGAFTVGDAPETPTG